MIGCKPNITVLPVKSDGPCFFTIRSFPDACAAFSQGWSWRARISNVLRRWADKVERSQSFVIVPHTPSQIVWTDVADAATLGFNGATQYLNDLWRDRVLGSTDREPLPMVSTMPVTKEAMK